MITATFALGALCGLLIGAAVASAPTKRPAARRYPTWAAGQAEGD